MFRQMYQTFSGFFMGMLIGVGVALLLAPSSGEEIRRRLQTNLEQAQMRVTRAVQDYQAKAQQVSDISRQMVGEQKTSLKTGTREAINVIKAP